MSDTAFIEQVHQEVDNIQWELGCSEDEAWYTLQHLARSNSGEAVEEAVGLLE
jgi:hypothetical protein